MKLSIRSFFAGLTWILLAGPSIYGSPLHAAQISTETMLNFEAAPPLNVGGVSPLVLMVMSRDEQLFYKAYTDYTDLDGATDPDGDGIPEITYDNAIEYAGYFDPGLCYTYSGGQFKAAAPATGHACSSQWSGNLLNWATMSRLDVLRRVLYGGKRFTDTATKTVIANEPIPNDSHAWAKVLHSGSNGSYTPHTDSDITFCIASTGDVPHIKVVKGAYTEWASTAVTQCQWKEEAATDPSYDDDAPKTAALGGNGGLYTLRVEVCDPEAPTLPNGTALRESYCRQYGDSWKPAGVLQQYGESGELRFGLMTGSYAAPRSGGRLRRNIGRFAGNGGDETACVAGDEVKLSDGTLCNQVAGDAGIINTLDRFALVGWNGSSWTDCSTYGILNRGGTRGHLDNPGGSSDSYDCAAWGNPISEIYAEALRYITGETTPTTAFVAGNEDDYIVGWPSPIWVDPYRSVEDGGSPYCASCNIMVISTGLNSFDSDEVPSVPNLSKQAYAATTQVGVDELIDGGTYMIGRTLAAAGDLAVGNNVDTSSDLCEARVISDFGLARGICPDIPSLEGSYYIAGLAYEAWTNDLRPGLEKPDEFDVKAQTYAIALAENVPSFQIPVGSSKITITPLCQAHNDGSAIEGTPDPDNPDDSEEPWRSCGFLALQLGTKTSRKAPDYVYGRPLDGATSGSFAVVWEDSTWGNDHDVDVVEMITYCVVGDSCDIDLYGDTADGGSPDDKPDICWRTDPTAHPADDSTNVGCDADGTLADGLPDGTLLVRAENLSAYAGNAMLTGFAISGAASGNGPQRIVLRPGRSDDSILSSNAEPPDDWYKPQVRAFTAGTAAGVLKNPLYYAAKYGGFHECDPADPSCDANGKPDQVAEWDRLLADGSAGQDGVPDNFFKVSNPAELERSLKQLFSAIIATSGSGTAAAVVANSANGVGLIYQALYEGEREDESGRTVAWSGALNGLWVDSSGRMREDGDQDHVLDDYDIDQVIEFTTAPDTRQAAFQRFLPDPDNPGEFIPQGGLETDLSDIKAVWKAQDLLNVDAATMDAISQEDYENPLDTERYIFTWIDLNHDGVVDEGEQTDFSWNDSSGSGGFHGDVNTDDEVAGTFSYLNTDTLAEAENIVNWIRGEEVSGMRNRTIADPDNPGDTFVMRLGDVVNSTPTVVATPAEGFDLLYNDASYGEFREHYRDRRQVIYVGANDGMLHAFNGGFYNASTKTLQETPTDVVGGRTIGAEMWAYVPGNLLPHLRWLTNPNYTHVYYADGTPIAFDAKVFEPDETTHIEGWGTLLVAPFRMGGGPISVKVASDPTSSTPACTLSAATDADCAVQESGSAYVVMDITDPEQAPEVIAELRTGTFTTSVPAVAIEDGKFFLFVGSGSTDNGGLSKRAGSDQNATIDVYDVAALATGAVNATTPVRTFTVDCQASSHRGCFAGDLIAADFDLDNRAEALYFGTVVDKASNNNEFGGNLWKIDLAESDTPASWSLQQVYTADRPVTARPTVARNNLGQPMVFFGTGRMFTKSDLATTESQRILGLVDTSFLTGATIPALPLSDAALLNVSTIDVHTDATVDGAAGGIDDFTELMQSFDDGDQWGWYRNLESGSGPSERVVSFQTLLGGILLTTAYTPGTDICTDLGSGRIFGLNYRTGTADPSVAFFGANESDVINTSTELGPGLPAPPSLHVGSQGNDPATSDRNVRACIQTSSGAIICKDIVTLQSVRSGEISWREPVN